MASFFRFGLDRSTQPLRLPFAPDNLDVLRQYRERGILKRPLSRILTCQLGRRSFALDCWPAVTAASIAISRTLTPGVYHAHAVGACFRLVRSRLHPASTADNLKNYRCKKNFQGLLLSAMLLWTFPLLETAAAFGSRLVFSTQGTHRSFRAHPYAPAFGAAQIFEFAAQIFARVRKHLAFPLL